MIRYYYEAAFGGNPIIIRIVTDSSLSAVTTAGWLNSAINEGLIVNASDVLLISYAGGGASVNFFTHTVSNGIYTVSLASNNVALPTVAGNLAIYANTAGAFTENIAALNTVTLASATPGTVRSVIGSTVNSVLLTSGNIVGVRGVVNYVGASGGFIYGCQGKVICTGALTSSEWSAGLFGQLDVSAATINAGQISAIWADWGATGATATSMTGARLYAGTNTTANILNAQMYLYGPATNLLELDDNSGAYGATYITSGGSGGLSGTIKKIAITINGVAYYIPCATVVS